MPSELLTPGKKFGINNLNFRSGKHSVTYQVRDGKNLNVTLESTSENGVLPTMIMDETGKAVATGRRKGKMSICEFAARNGNLYSVTFG